MAEYRTTQQAEANKLDYKLFMLSSRLADFARIVGDDTVDDASRLVFGLRGRVQRHMHKNDIRSIARSIPPTSEEG